MPSATSRKSTAAPAATPAAPVATRRERDPVAAKQALIAAAVAEFATKGFAGARVDEIAAAAGVNKQLVYHYFESKQGLYLVALESVYAEIREKEQKLELGALEPREAMAQLVAFSFDYLAEHPEFIAMLADENRNRGEHLHESERLQKMHSPFIEMLEATLERGVARACSAPTSTRSTSTSRSPASPTSSSRTTTRCRPSSARRSTRAARCSSAGAT